MELACDMFVVRDRERQSTGEDKEREEGRKDVREERSEVRQMERMEDIGSNKMHNELKM
jgi:hypothetical protein